MSPPAFRTNINDTGFIQFGERSFTHVRDVSGDLFLSARPDTRQFLTKMVWKRSSWNNTLGYEDGVFEVATIPRHERYAHVPLTKRQFTEVGGRTVVCQHVAGRSPTGSPRDTHGIWLIQVFWLERVYLSGCRCRYLLHPDTSRLVNFDNDTGSIHVPNDTTTFSYRSYTGVNGNSTFHTSTNQRLISTQEFERLTLHAFAPINARLASSCSRTGSGTHRRIPPAGWIRPCSQPVMLNKLDSPFATASYRLLRSGLLHPVGVRPGDNVVAFFDSRQV